MDWRGSVKLGRMREQGNVSIWKADKGFGFIKPARPGADVFFHIADFRSASGMKPAVGLAVSYEVIHVGGKGPRAMALRPVSEEARRSSGVAARREPSTRRPRGGTAPASGAGAAVPLMLVYYGLMGTTIFLGRMPLWVLGASFLVNVLTFFAYWLDKYRATQRAWRIPESTLHLWSLAGGWPGAFLAQQILRHKSVKAAFRGAYWVTVFAHCAIAAGWVWYLRLLPLSWGLGRAG